MFLIIIYKDWLKPKIVWEIAEIILNNILSKNCYWMQHIQQLPFTVLFLISKANSAIKYEFSYYEAEDVSSMLCTFIISCEFLNTYEKAYKKTRRWLKIWLLDAGCKVLDRMVQKIIKPFSARLHQRMLGRFQYGALQEKYGNESKEEGSWEFKSACNDLGYIHHWGKKTCFDQEMMSHTIRAKSFFCHANQTVKP